MSERRCTNCILPESYPGITFDAQGRCHLCQSYRKPAVKGQAALRDLIGSRRGDQYDALVTLSGGRDSSYVLYYGVKVLGLRVLPVSYDNGFRHPQAAKNIDEACRRLGLQRLERRSKDHLNARITAQALHSTVPFGPGPACQFICRACYNGGLAFLYSLVDEYRIPFVLWGDSLIEKITFIPIRRAALGLKSPLRYLLSPRGPAFLNFLRLLLVQRNEKLPPGNSPLDPRFPRLRNSNVQEIHLFDYVEWDREEIKHRITEELGWQKPPESLSSWRFDCHLHSLVNYCHKKAIGFNHDVDGLANMVRAGKMSRAEAMELIEKGFDSDQWNEHLEGLCRDVLHLPESDIAVLKSW